MRYPLVLLAGLAAGCPSGDTDTETDADADTDTDTDTDTDADPVQEVDCGSVTPDETVSMVNLTFEPDTLTVSAGDIVLWTNDDAVVHTVTSGGPGAETGVFDSGDIDPGGSYCLQFDEAAFYDYFCTVHPTQMQAELTVQ